MSRAPIDLGMGLTGRFVGWHPDRDLNPQYAGIADVEDFSLAIYEGYGTDNEVCRGIVNLDTPGARAVPGMQGYFWQVHSWEPLTLTPSILDKTTGWGGFITNGKWVPR